VFRNKVYYCLSVGMDNKNSRDSRYLFRSKLFHIDTDRQQRPALIAASPDQERNVMTAIPGTITKMVEKLQEVLEVYKVSSWIIKISGPRWQRSHCFHIKAFLRAAEYMEKFDLKGSEHHLSILEERYQQDVKNHNLHKVIPIIKEDFILQQNTEKEEMSIVVSNFGQTPHFYVTSTKSNELEDKISFLASFLDKSLANINSATGEYYIFLAPEKEEKFIVGGFVDIEKFIDILISKNIPIEDRESIIKEFQYKEPERCYWDGKKRFSSGSVSSNKYRSKLGKSDPGSTVRRESSKPDKE